VPSITMLVTPEGEYVLPDAANIVAAAETADRDDDPVSQAVKNRGFIRLQMIEDAIVEVELHPHNVKLAALLAVQQQLQTTDMRLFRIKYFDTEWQSEICSSAERTIARLSELCAPIFLPSLSEMYIAEARDISIVFDDYEHFFRPLAQKWRVSFGYFDPTVIAVAVQHDLLSSLTVVGVKPFEPEPVFRFIGQGHHWAGSQVARVGERVADQPDREYGRWLSEFFKFVASSRQPRYDLVTARLQAPRGGESPQTVSFERLLLPWKTSSNEVFVTSCSVIAEQPVPP
jgi:hypothetical protein